MILDNYLNAYLDRRLKYHIEEWQIATKKDVGDVSQRIAALEQELAPHREFEKNTSARITELEGRLKRIREARK